jgi:hypothetical protein
VSETAAQPPPTGAGRWIAARRIKLALAIAVFEGIVVAFAKDFSSWTVIIISIPIIAFYLFAGRRLDSDTWRQVSWVLAASQAFAVLLAVIALTVKLWVLIIVGIFAVIALVLIVGEKPGKSSGEKSRKSPGEQSSESAGETPGKSAGQS